MAIKGLAKAWILTAAAFLSGCIMTTHVVEHYDDECQILTRHVVLDAHQADTLGSCSDTTQCTGALVGAGFISAASAVVAGSVVLVGNTVYWFEKQGRCQKKKQA